MISSNLNENIAVVVRARPFNNEETKLGCHEAWSMDPLSNTITSLPPPTTPTSTLAAPKTPAKSLNSSLGPPRTPAKSSLYSSSSAHPPPSTPSGKFIPNEYTYDHLFLPNIENIDVYTSVAKGIITSTMEGFNGVIFAYGQTASGKTFTMKGTGRKNPGVIPLAIQDVFSFIANDPNREFLLRISYLEIYNEVINDLLAPENINLKVHENPQSGEVFVGGLKEEIVLSYDHVLSVIASGEAHRHVGSTNFNDQSSRSHTIFRLVVESKPVADSVDSSSQGVRVSCLNLIDLAGSERASEGAQSIRNKEGAYINKSLLTLGSVISKLSEKTKGHINYRDSKLTRILQNSLGGNSKIAIICTITLANNNFEESHSTLKFASRAKNIVNNAKVNETVDDKTLIKQYRNEIAELKNKLEEANRRGKDIVPGGSAADELNKKLMEAEKHKNLLESKIQHLTKLILVSTSISNAKKSAGMASPGSSSMSARNTIQNVSSAASPSSIDPLAEIDPHHLSEHIKNSLAIEEKEIQLKSKIAKLELDVEEKSKIIETLKSGGKGSTSPGVTAPVNVNDRIKELEAKLKEKDDSILSLEFKIKGYTEKFKEFYSENTVLKKKVNQLQDEIQRLQNQDGAYEYDEDGDEMY
ncbi:kinesin family member 11 [Cavenderia fasciculata]|uniref:Kinesin family member 11 n=1 Tax=Cavenderia fasciculata TaxID=261658 RepID=F4PV22_CACFS|nr:kinesin family member 11 [Cavenderia fasciculata]EGG21138.1 kinesin family member 11 [Cavenderia fasciculata]|eukprot:XP_004358988.1 kinesin family member 11 [Cavenderia fasciculata]